MLLLRLTLPRNILKLGIIFLVLVITVLFWYNSEALFEGNVKAHRSLLSKKDLVPDSRNLFFLETTCAINTKFASHYTSRGLQLNKRQACAIYSTAILNPCRRIILYHSCPLHKNYYARSAVYIKYLLDLNNFYIFQEKLQDLMKGSIIEHIYEDLRDSHYPIQHTADILRVLMVYQFGGAYLDLDFISTKPINTLPKNFIGDESELYLSNGVFQFESQGIGHEFVREILEDLALNYNNVAWAANGPDVFTKVFRKFCNLSENMPIPQISYPCGISVSNASLFFPVNYKSWEKLFFPAKKEYINQLLEYTIAIHFWNNFSKDRIVKIGENSVYETIARNCCEKILLTAGPKF